MSETIREIIDALGLGQLYDEAIMWAEEKKAAGNREMYAYWVGAMGMVQDSAMTIHDKIKLKDYALIAYLKRLMDEK